MDLPEACLGSLAPPPLHTMKSYTHMNPCHALTFFFWEKKLSQPKIEHFSALKKKQHSWEFRQIALVRRCLTDPAQSETSQAASLSSNVEKRWVYPCTLPPTLQNKVRSTEPAATSSSVRKCCCSPEGLFYWLFKEEMSPE